MTSEKTLSEIRNLKSRSNELNSEITRLTTLVSSQIRRYLGTEIILICKTENDDKNDDLADQWKQNDLKPVDVIYELHKVTNETWVGSLLSIDEIFGWTANIKV